MSTQDGQDGERLAPGRLRLVQDFVNTADIGESTDEIGDPDRLASWMRGHGLLGAGDTVPAGAHERAISVREALRALLLANAGGPVYPIAVSILNQAAARTPLRVRFLPSGAARLEPGGTGAEAALGRILAAAQEAMALGTWGRLKACREDACRWAFYDHSKNRSRAWCSMAVCGNRAKARAYRGRRSGS